MIQPRLQTAAHIGSTGEQRVLNTLALDAGKLTHRDLNDHHAQQQQDRQARQQAAISAQQFPIHSLPPRSHSQRCSVILRPLLYTQSSQARMPTPPLQGRRAGPLPPGAVERALLAVAEQQGDLAKL